MPGFGLFDPRAERETGAELVSCSEERREGGSEVEEEIEEREERKKDERREKRNVPSRVAL